MTMKSYTDDILVSAIELSFFEMQQLQCIWDFN